MACAGHTFPTWEESPKSQAGVHYPFPTRVGNSGKLFPASAPPRRAPLLLQRLADHAVHADHRAGHQLEREEAPLLDPAGQLQMQRQIAAEAELIVVLGVADQDDS